MAFLRPRERESALIGWRCCSRIRNRSVTLSFFRYYGPWHKNKRRQRQKDTEPSCSKAQAIRTMSIEWFIAQRYLRSPNRPAVLRLVTVFSVIGVAAGVCTLVISLAMNTGFRETLQDHLLTVTSHVSLTHPGSSSIRDYQQMAAGLAGLPGVKSATPAVYQTVLMSFGGQARGIVTKGIDAESEARNDQALHKLSAGKLEFAPDEE